MRSSARTDLSGGRWETSVPTATGAPLEAEAEAASTGKAARQDKASVMRRSTAGRVFVVVTLRLSRRGRDRRARLGDELLRRFIEAYEGAPGIVRSLVDFHDKLPSRSLIVGMLVSSASAIRLSLHPSPASDTSAFRRMRAFVSKCGARLPLRIKSSSRARSSSLSSTTYFLTATSCLATQSSPSRNRQGIDLDNPVKLNDVSH